MDFNPQYNVGKSFRVDVLGVQDHLIPICIEGDIALGRLPFSSFEGVNCVVPREESSTCDSFSEFLRCGVHARTQLGIFDLLCEF